MNTRRLTPEERYELVLECRSSGLSDHQWLEEHGIPASTFYNWITKFRKSGYPDIPKPMSQNTPHRAQHQEVVQVNVLPEPINMEQNTPTLHQTASSVEPTMEIIAGRTVIRLSNHTDPQLLEIVLDHLGGRI